MSAEGDIAPEARSYRRVALEYARGRPSYAPEAITALAEALGWSRPNARPVVDIGAGTGTFSRLLAARGIEVVAVEPVAEMRARIADIPGVTALEGRAESIPVKGGAFGSAVAATAFHWFANEPALREIKRVTRPPHRLGLVWNDRDHMVDWVQAYDAIIEPYAGTAPRYRSGAWRRALQEAGVKVGECLAYPNPQPTTPARIIDRALSTSFIAALPSPQRQTVNNALLALTSTMPDELSFPYTTDVYIVELGEVERLRPFPTPPGHH